MMDRGFPLVLEVGKLGQGHNDIFKKVTTPTGVAVVSMKKGFGPSLPSIPEIVGYAEKSHL
jgi:hypothetical protein